MIKHFHIFDFDGTLVDSSHRYRTMPCGTRIDLQHWRDNEHKAMQDSLLPLVDEYRKILADPEHYVVIATARIGDDITKRFMARHGLTPQSFIARKNSADSRGGAQLKITGVRRLLNLKQFRGVETIHVYEDNESYLQTLCNAFNAIPHFFRSNQGH